MTPGSAAAYRANGQPVAREVFYALACNPQRSAVVEACAGAGKTWMLVSRVLRALLEGAQPHEILAITFTRKAAGEMRQRLNDWLREFAAPDTPHSARVQALLQRGVPAPQAPELAVVLQGLHEKLLLSGRTVEVKTFHAWFAQLLRAAPLEFLAELGLQPEAELIESLNDHFSPVFSRFYAAVAQDAGLRFDHQTQLAQRGRTSTRQWFEVVLNRRIEFELADAAGVLQTSLAPAQPFDAHPARALQSTAWRARLHALAVALGGGAHKAQEAATGLVMALAAPDAQALFSKVWSALFTEKNTPRKQLGAAAGLAEVQAELETLAQHIHQFEAQEEHLRMARLSRVLLAEFAAYKRSKGLADMADLEQCGLHLLRDATLSGWVQERLDTRIRHVLMDEFQDTSPLQWHALQAWLAGYSGAGGGASGQQGPSVFIVGDPKQSIYRFRRAEPRVFAAARQFVVQALGGVALECDHTRRNSPEVLGALNAVFLEAAATDGFAGFRAHTTELPAGGVALAEVHLLPPTFAPAVFTLPRVQRPPRAKRAEAAVAAWRDTLHTPRHEPETVLREQEAAQVAHAVHGLVHGQGVPPGEIFVMSRKRQSLRLVARALQRLHVPYAAPEDFDLMQAPEAQDLLAVLDFLVFSHHRLSLARALRSPLLGASDEDLMALAQQAAGGDWWQALLQLKVPSAALERARALLQRWQLAAQTLPPHDLLDRIVFESDACERVAATVPLEQRAAALEVIAAVLAQALLLDGGRYATPCNLVRALQRRVITLKAPAHPDAVQLLTVHGAKGLEAPFVFVMDCDPQPQHGDTTAMLVDWPVEASSPVTCGLVYAEAACPPSLQALRDAEQLAREREELNGLYVAMSRAKQCLVFSATQPSYASPRPSWWHRIQPHAVPWPVTSFSASAPNPTADDHCVVLSTLPHWENPQAIPSSAAVVEQAALDAPAARLGQAVHRVLEWAYPWPPRRTAPLEALAQAAAVGWGVNAQAVQHISQAMARSPACARFFSGAALRWAGNEVTLGHAGQTLRVDRLVLVDEAQGPTWWVLDYKLHPAPDQNPSYCQQLEHYRSAVLNAQPGARVRCAFVTGEGAVLERLEAQK
jgi:ATP-dependent helicase/nuclease subunit A